MEFKFVLSEKETEALCNAAVSTMTEERRVSHNQFIVNMLSAAEDFCKKHADQIVCMLDVLTAIRACTPCDTEDEANTPKQKDADKSGEEVKAVKLDNKPEGK